MSHRGSFNESLRLGEQCQDIALRYIQREFPKAYIRSGYFKEHDIYIPEVDKSVEVKLDLVAKETGNFGIEFRCNGKNSGISTTNADRWFIFQKPDSVFISIKTDNLKDLCRKYKNRRAKAKLDNVSEMVLIPCLELIIEAKIIYC